jgi:hypothetical protein
MIDNIKMRIEVDSDRAKRTSVLSATALIGQYK